MKTLLKALPLLCITFFISSHSYAHNHGHDHSHDDGHSHGHVVNQETVKKTADKVIASLVKRERVDKSWSSITASSLEKKIISDVSVWVVTFNNQKIVEEDKQNLYVFISLEGEFLAVNHTGE